MGDFSIYVLLVNSLLIVICLILLPLPCNAADEVFAIFSSDISPYRQAYEGFKETISGRFGKLSVVAHYLDKEGANNIVQQIGERRPLLILAIGPESSKFAKDSIKKIPVVFAMVLYPKSLDAPNITWVSLEIPIGTRLDRVRKILSGIKKIGVIYSPKAISSYREIEQVSKKMGFIVVGKEIGKREEFPEAFKDMASQIDLFFMIPDTTIYSSETISHLLVEAMKVKVPVIGLASAYTRAGALVSFEADYTDIGRQAGEISVRILNGERPANIEPLSPRTVKTSLNLAVAGRLGINIDREEIGKASDVYR